MNPDADCTPVFTAFAAMPSGDEKEATACAMYLLVPSPSIVSANVSTSSDDELKDGAAFISCYSAHVTELQGYCKSGSYYQLVADIHEDIALFNTELVSRGFPTVVDHAPSEGLSSAEIAGIVIGSVAGLGLIIGLAVGISKRKNGAKRRLKTKKQAPAVTTTS